MNVVRQFRGFAVTAFPQIALANTGPLPLSFGLAMVSLLVIPGVAIFAIARMWMVWRKGRLDGVWVVSGLGAATIGGLGLWLLFTLAGPLSLSSWPLVYLALVPVLSVWAASMAATKRDT